MHVKRECNRNRLLRTNLVRTMTVDKEISEQSNRISRLTNASNACHCQLVLWSQMKIAEKLIKNKFWFSSVRSVQFIAINCFVKSMQNKGRKGNYLTLSLKSLSRQRMILAFNPNLSTFTHILVDEKTINFKEALLHYFNYNIYLNCSV